MFHHVEREMIAQRLQLSSGALYCTAGDYISCHIDVKFVTVERNFDKFPFDKICKKKNLIIDRYHFSGFRIMI